MAPPSNSQASIIWRKELSPQPWNAEIRCLRSAELDIRGLTDIISEEDRNDRDRCEVPNHTRHNDSVSRGGGSPTDRHFRAQRTIICEDLLSDELRHRLQTPENDPYRSESGLCVQVAISAALSNSPVDISAIALVCPRHLMPNGYNGILFGQSGCINSLVYTSIPRKILVKQGEEIGDSIWGDLVLRTYIDIFGDVHAF
ncbi:uracil DNA glycosylase [Arachnomyces sp. PD_36]|nr:uracil DNA glycosylase [Arachnomyces sp. PD_36]